MTKAELIEKVAKSAKITKAQANEAINGFVESIKGGLKKEGTRITMTGFGTFSTIKRAARTGRNPRTGQTIKISAKRTPKFTPGKAFKEAIK
jgi:DNA-binding protein HU-beta